MRVYTPEQLDQYKSVLLLFLRQHPGWHDVMKLAHETQLTRHEVRAGLSAAGLDVVCNGHDAWKPVEHTTPEERAAVLNAIDWQMSTLRATRESWERKFATLAST